MKKVLVTHEIVRLAEVQVSDTEYRVLNTYYNSDKGRNKRHHIAQTIINRANKQGMEDDWAGTEIETLRGKTLYSVG